MKKNGRLVPGLSVRAWWCCLIQAACLSGQALFAQTPIQGSVEAQPAASPADEAITETIRKNFILDTQVPPNLIQAETHDRVVTLSGAVDNELARERAVQIARAVQGVRQVRDLVQFQPTRASDDSIRKTVRMKLADDSALHAIDIQVTVENGIVTLAGTVPSWAERAEAAQVAKAVKGVRGLENGLSVEPTPSRSDPQILADVEDRLHGDVHASGAAVRARVEDGKVSLSGAAPNIAAISALYADSWVPGVRSVDTSGVVILPSAAAISSEEPAVPMSPAAGAPAPGEVQRGTVVSGGDNRPIVNVPAQPDSTILENVRAALSATPGLGNVTVTVANGVVTLNGTVLSWQQRRLAEALANQVTGVHVVKNQLEY